MIFQYICAQYFFNFNVMRNCKVLKQIKKKKKKSKITKKVYFACIDFLTNVKLNVS